MSLSKKIKVSLLSVFGITVLLATILAVHIYIVTKPKADAQTVALARVDFKEDINQNQADKISGWLYKQPGVEHVLCNSKTEVLVFSFHPFTTDANKLVADLKSNFKLEKAQRFMPAAAELKGGCPVASTSLTYRMYTLLKKI